MKQTLKCLIRLDPAEFQVSLTTYRSLAFTMSMLTAQSHIIDSGKGGYNCGSGGKGTAAVKVITYTDYYYMNVSIGKQERLYNPPATGARRRGCDRDGRRGRERRHGCGDTAWSLGNIYSAGLFIR